MSAEREADLIIWCNALAAEDRLAGTIKDALRLYQHLAAVPVLRDLARSGLLCEAVRLGWVEISMYGKPHTGQSPLQAHFPAAPATSKERTTDWDATLRNVLGIG